MDKIYKGADKTLTRPGRKQANVSNRMAWISFGALQKKKTWWQLASRCRWNRARPWHASELVSFLVGLRSYQHPCMCMCIYVYILHYGPVSFIISHFQHIAFLSIFWNFGHPDAISSVVVACFVRKLKKSNRKEYLAKLATSILVTFYHLNCRQLCRITLRLLRMPVPFHLIKVLLNVKYRVMHI